MSVDINLCSFTKMQQDSDINRDRDRERDRTRNRDVKSLSCTHPRTQTQSLTRTHTHTHTHTHKRLPQGWKHTLQTHHNSVGRSYQWSDATAHWKHLLLYARHQIINDGGMNSKRVQRLATYKLSFRPQKIISRIRVSYVWSASYIWMSHFTHMNTTRATLYDRWIVLDEISERHKRACVRVCTHVRQI